MEFVKEHHRIRRDGIYCTVTDDLNAVTNNCGTLCAAFNNDNSGGRCINGACECVSNKDRVIIIVL